MANIIEIITREIVEGKGNIAGIGKELDTVQDKANDVNSGQKDLAATFKGSWTEISSMLNVGAQAIELVGEAYSKTIGVFVDYAEQVRNISQVTGESAEEVSRLLQVTDDYKIDAEKLTQVMKKMAREGFAFTTDALADLSDEYIKIQDPVERTNFLFDTFGREGEAFAEVMLEGGDAIRKHSAAISDNLILTQQAIDDAREYERAMDALKETTEALAISIGGELIPAVTFYATLLETIITDTKNVTSATDLLGIFFDKLGDLGWGNIPQTNEQLEIMANKLDEEANAARNAASATEDFGKIASTTVNGAQMLDTQNKKLADSITAMKDAEVAYVDYKNANPQDTAGIQAMRDKWVGLAENVKDVQDANDLQTKAWLANILLQQLSLGPEGLSGAEMAFYLQYMEDSGLMTEESRIKTEAMYNDMVTMAGGFANAATQAENISKGLAKIPKEVKSTVTITETTIRKVIDYSGDSSNRRAMGGGINAGSMLFDGAFADGGGFGGNYLWNESAQSRPEVFVGGGGYVLTKQDAMNALGGGAGGGVNLVLNYSPMVSLADQNEIETKLLPYIRKALRNV